MDLLNNLSPGQIVVLIIGLLLAAAGAITTVGGAVEKIAKLIHVAKAPNAAQDQRIEVLENQMKDVYQFLASDKKRLDAIEDANRISLRAQLALLEHGIDGNNIKRMQASREEIENHLINR